MRNKIVMYIITSKLNSTFRRIGIATGAKMIAKAVVKTPVLTLA